MRGIRRTPKGIGIVRMSYVRCYLIWIWVDGGFVFFFGGQEEEYGVY